MDKQKDDKLYSLNCYSSMA